MTARPGSCRRNSAPAERERLLFNLRGEPLVILDLMFDHVSFGVADLPRSKHFYDQALKRLGYVCLSESGDSLGYGRNAVRLWIGRAERPVAPDPGSGLHFCFVAAIRENVDRFHAAALAAGGKDNGKPGLRASYGDSYYAAFVIDPDGYRLEAFCGS